MFAHAYINRIRNSNENCNGEFQNQGFVTRGADWYEIIGGMQDYGYFNYGTIELTMEISCCKYPTSNLLLSYWNYNRDSMVELLYQAQRGQIDRMIKCNKMRYVSIGVKGLILNGYSKPIPSAQVMINDRRPVVKTTALGEFWRILLPGTYTLKVSTLLRLITTIKCHFRSSTVVFKFIVNQ